MNIYYVGGEFVAEDQAKIAVGDLSVLRGFGVFDFLRTYHGIPFHLDDHLRRLERSARLIGLMLPKSLSEIRDLVAETLRRNHHPESNIRLVVTGGVSSDGITPGKRPQLLIMITPVKESPTNWQATGAKVVTSHMERFLPGAKSINYIPAILSQRLARSQQAIEAIYVDRNGYLLEGTTSNFLVFVGDRLITPPVERVLPGITRQVVLELARDLFPIVERPLHQDELPLVDEAFLTSSAREVVPITAVDATTVGDGQPGSRTGTIVERFAAYTASYGCKPPA